MSTYDTDYAAWAGEQAALLRSGKMNDLDIDHIAEELESIMGNERRELYRRFRALIAHLLKWQFQPDHRSSGWRGTIRYQRADIAHLLKESPSLRRDIPERIREAYPEARELAADESGLIEEDLPRLCPYTQEEILDSNFWPD